jgi:hypothetical protein
MSDSGKPYVERPPIESHNIMFFKEMRRLSGVAHRLAYLD